MTQEMYNELVSEFAKLKGISEREAATIIRTVVRTFTEGGN